MRIENKQELSKLRKRIENKIAGLYEKKLVINGQNCYLQGKEHYFLITGLWFGLSGALVIEHADSYEEATISEVGRFEDGDLFYLEDFAGDEDKMLQTMIREIEDYR